MNKLASRETLTGTTSTIESDCTFAVVSFPLKSAIQRMTESSPGVENGANVAENVGNGAENVDVNENDGKNVPVNLTEIQKQILNLIKNNQHITHQGIAERLSITDKTAKRATMALRQLGMIRREGSDNTGYWIITEN